MEAFMPVSRWSRSGRLGMLAVGMFAVDFWARRELPIAATVAVSIAVSVAARLQFRLDLRQLIDERLRQPLNAAAAAAVAELGGEPQQALGLRPGQLRVLQPLFRLDNQFGHGNIKCRRPRVESANRQIGGLFLEANCLDGRCKQTDNFVTG